MKTLNGCVALLAFFLLAGCSAAASDTSAGAEASNEEITNNQESGVDEGGIVKNIGDHLVVLREGRLFAMNVAESGDIEQTDWADVPRDASLKSPSGVWYDEMLVEGNDIYVVGYRYNARIWDGRLAVPRRGGATEINHFVLDDEGTLERKESLFFESHDYFSGSNYASRMIDDKLIFYMPIYDGAMNNVLGTGMPNLLGYAGNRMFLSKKALLKESDIQEASDARDAFHGETIHAIFTCSVANGAVEDCEGRAVRSGWFNTRYVTQDAVYLADDRQFLRLSLTDGSIATQRADGQIYNQFAMHTDDENFYAVKVRGASADLVTIPHDEFGEAEPQYTRLLQGSGQVYDLRFTDGFVVVPGRSERSGDDQLTRVAVHELATGETTTLELAGSVEQVKRLHGIGALLVGHEYDPTTGGETWFHTVMLEGGPKIAQSTSAAELGSEWRSHAFFYKPNKDPMTGGTFGIPVYAQQDGWNYASGLGFYTVSAEGEIAAAGSVYPSGDAGPGCETSCIDWYGNSRPIFLFDRIYALMGYELAEVAPDGDGALSEVSRLEMTLQ